MVEIYEIMHIFPVSDGKLVTCCAVLPLLTDHACRKLVCAFAGTAAASSGGLGLGQ